jgi:phthalate 4,5-dioxygenase reductase component
MAEALNPELVTELRVDAATPAAADIRQFELVSPDGAELAEFTPGAHLLVQAPNGMTRRYSVTNPPDERHHYVIAVKREANGRGGSISMVDSISAGDLMHASLPRNEFELKGGAPSYLFIAGGIGITPIRSMIHHVMNAGDKPFTAYYFSREPAMTAYREEFAAPEFHGKVVIHHDYGDPSNSLDLWPVLEKPTRAHIYCCGPTGLMDAVRDMTGHWPTSAVHFEDFGTRKPARAADDKPLTVRFGMDGEPIEVPVGVSILEALRSKGLRIRSSCESGTCGTCRMKLLAGEADHRDLVLTDSERLREIIVCMSRAHSPELVVAL